MGKNRPATGRRAHSKNLISLNDIHVKKINCHDKWIYFLAYS